MSIAIVVAALAFTGKAQEWTRFRGPNGTGISQAKTIPTKITDADINWKVELPGTGHSSPVLWGERVFLTSTGDKSGGISVLCLSAQDGHLLWRRDFSLTPFARHPHNSFASSTAAVDAQRVYVVWNEPQHYLLTALDHDGKTVWQRDFGQFVSQHGCGISPIIYKDKVISRAGDAKIVPASPPRSQRNFVCRGHENRKTLWQTLMPAQSWLIRLYYLFQKEQKPISFLTVRVTAFTRLMDKPKFCGTTKRRSTNAASAPVIAGASSGSCGSGAGALRHRRQIRGATTGRKTELAYQVKNRSPFTRL
jgi:hypothetical protein